MISKQQLLDSMQHEINIIKHLAGKLRTEDLDYRPSEKQRSMLELLQYISVCASGPAVNCVSGNWDHMDAMNKKAGEVSLEQFQGAMDEQMTIIGDIVADFSDEELAKKDAQTPWGVPIKAGVALMDMSLKCLVAYRMQLFLYAKAAGHDQLGPANCWAGIDWPPQED